MEPSQTVWAVWLKLPDGSARLIGEVVAPDFEAALDRAKRLVRVIVEPL